MEGMQVVAATPAAASRRGTHCRSENCTCAPKAYHGSRTRRRTAAEQAWEAWQAGRAVAREAEAAVTVATGRLEVAMKEAAAMEAAMKEAAAMEAAALEAAAIEAAGQPEAA